MTKNAPATIPPHDAAAVSAIANRLTGEMTGDAIKATKISLAGK